MEKYFIDQYKINYDLNKAFDPESKENKNLKKNIAEFYKNLEDYVNKYNTVVAAYNKNHKKSTLSECDFKEVKKDIYMYWGSKSTSQWFDQYIHYRITGNIDLEYKDYYDFYNEHGGLYIQTQIEQVSDEEILAYIKYYMDKRYIIRSLNEDDYRHSSNNIKKKCIMNHIWKESPLDICAITPLYPKHISYPIVLPNYKSDYGIYSRFDRLKVQKDSAYYDALTSVAKRESFERDEMSRMFMEDATKRLKDAGIYNEDMTLSEIITKNEKIKKQQEYEQLQVDIASGKIKISIIDKMFNIMPIWLLKTLAAFPARHSWMLLFLLLCPFANRGLSGAIFIIVVYGTGSIIGLIANEYLKARDNN